MTLSTSKMELFVTTGICKVIFSRLKILYTQYCPMNVISLLVPFHSRCFHLKTSEMMLFVTVAIPNVVFCWAIVLGHEFLVFCVSSLLSSYRYRYFHLVSVDPARSRWFQFVPTLSSFQYVHKNYGGRRLLAELLLKSIFSVTVLSSIFRIQLNLNKHLNKSLQDEHS